MATRGSSHTPQPEAQRALDGIADTFWQAALSELEAEIKEEDTRKKRARKPRDTNPDHMEASR